MNRSKIGWCDYTWNPITGCRHSCPYCYARKMTARFSGDINKNKAAVKDYQIQEAPDGSGRLYILDYPMLSETGNQLVYPFGFEPTLHRYRFNILDKLKMGNNIFVCAMADLFGEWAPASWINAVIEECKARPQHNYLFLTKNPQRYIHNVPVGMDNMWYGTTITNENEISRFNSLPAGCNTFVSLEPLLEDLQPEQHNILFRQINWIILGAETGHRKEKVNPKAEWIQKIVEMADAENIPVFMKDSLVDIIGEKNMRREFPTQMKRKVLSEKLENKLYSYCCVCKKRDRKSEMVALSARSRRGEQPKQFAFICKECFNAFCKNNCITMPKLDTFEEER